jgi:hypothetical protein
MYDVVMTISDETNAEEHWQRLAARAKSAIRVTGAKSIREAYARAALNVSTPHFFMVDADNWLLDDFHFEIDFRPAVDEIVVWSARNPINGLESGHGGIKLLPTVLAQQALSYAEVDVSFSISDSMRFVRKVASEHRFNGSPFETWRTAFRECAKLASGAVLRQDQRLRNLLLSTWFSTLADAEFAYWCLLGARQGRAFGESCNKNVGNIRVINDYIRLRQMFELHALNFDAGACSTRLPGGWARPDR